LQKCNFFSGEIEKKTGKSPALTLKK